MTDLFRSPRRRLAPLMDARTTRRADGTLVLRPAYLTLIYSGMPVLALLIPLATWLGRGVDRDRGFFVLWLALITVDATVAILVGTRRQVQLGDRSLRHRNVLRWQTIAAEDIQAVTMSDMGLTETLRIWTADRQSHRPAALTTRELQLVGDWWIEYRGDDWRPAWGPPPPPHTSPGWALPADPWHT